jgi:hypothetical protein
VYVCTQAAYPGVVGKTNRLPCTLRQAIEEASSVIAADPGIRPVEIRFNIPTSDPGYDAELWACGVYPVDRYPETHIRAPCNGEATDCGYKAGQVDLNGTHKPEDPTAPPFIIRGPQNRNLTGPGHQWRWQLHPLPCLSEIRYGSTT